MATTLQIVDPENTNAILFDLNDPTSANSGLYGGVRTDLLSDVDWGSPELDRSIVQDSTLDIGYSTFSRRALASVKLKLRISNASSYDNMAKATARLADLLSRGGVLKWIANGSSDTRLIDFEPAPTPVLLHGQTYGMFQATVIFDSPDGVELTFERQPYMRSARLDPATNKMVSNPTLLRDSNGDGTPDGWTIVSTPTLTISAAQESLHVVAGAATRGVSQNTVTASASSGQTWTVAVDVLVASGTAALILDWRTAADATISTVTTTSTSTTWTRISATGVAPGTTDHIKVRLESSGAAATFDVRNCQAEQSATPTPFRVVAETVNIDPAASGFARIIPIYNPSSAPAPVEITAKVPDVTPATVEFLYGLRASDAVTGKLLLADYLNGPSYAQAEATGGNWTVTLGTDTSAAAGTGASGGGNNVARCTFATAISDITKRITWSRTTLLDSLRGELDVYVRVKAASLHQHRLQLRWSPGNADPAFYSNDEAVHDTTDSVSGGQWSTIYLGPIDLPTETNVTLGTLRLELWAALEQGATASNLDIDYLSLVPVQKASVTGPDGDSTVWLGDEMKKGVESGTNPTTLGHLLFFDDTTDSAGTAPVAGGIVQAGHHITRFRLGNGYASARNIDIRIRNRTDSTTVKTKTVAVMGNTNRVEKLIQWDAVAGKTYQAQVLNPGGVSTITKRNVYLRSVKDSFIPVVIQNEAIRTDPGSRTTRYVVEKIDSSNNLMGEWESTQVPFWAPPGLSLLYIECWDAANIGYNENTSVLTRTLTVTPAVYPRWWI
jgi:hypothetical protein